MQDEFRRSGMELEGSGDEGNGLCGIRLRYGGGNGHLREAPHDLADARQVIHIQGRGGPDGV